MGNTQGTESLPKMSTFDDHRDCLRADDTQAPTLQHVADKILNGDIDQIIVLAGAGISVSAGIPDFRSPGSGLYDNLGKYNLPEPEAIFDIDFFDANPFPFFRLSSELFPGKFRPTPTHYFLTLLHQKNVLRRVFTQNIDTLESVAGLPYEKYVACHGNFSTATCRHCGATYTQEWMMNKLFHDEITATKAQEESQEDGTPNVPVPKCDECHHVVKPDITFFGESLPPRFEKNVIPDAQRCDLLLVMGTSLQVYPVGQLPDIVGPWVPRVLFNRDPVHIANKMKLDNVLDDNNDDNDNDNGDDDDDDDDNVVDTGFWFDLKENYRDVFAPGDCDDTVREFVHLLGWTEEFETLIREGNEKFDTMKTVKEKMVREETTKEETKMENKVQDVHVSAITHELAKVSLSS
jgi:NAD-dependent deacetylase sirtuin 2